MGVGENDGWGRAVRHRKGASRVLLSQPIDDVAGWLSPETDITSGKRECIATEVPILVLQGIQGVSKAQARCLTSLFMPCARQGALFRA